MIEATDIAFAPLLPWAALSVMAALAAALLTLGFIRRAPGTGLRALALAVAFATLANPSLIRERREPLNDVAVIVVDRSPSQNVGDRRNVTADALEALTRRLNEEEGLDVRVQMAADADAPGAGTPLVAAARRALGDVPAERLAGILMLTDGQVHDVPADGEARIKAPVHALLTGRRGERDRRVRVLEGPAYGIVDEELSLVVEVADEQADGEPVEVVLYRDGRELARRAVRIGQPTRLPFRLGHGGETVLELAVDPVPGELTELNNRAAHVVNGVRDRLRVLLVSGEPHAGERVWRNILKSDPSVDLVHFTILRPPEKQDGTPIRELSLISFPTRELFQNKLNDFDLIIFDRYRRRGVLPDIYLQNVADFVAGGGAVLVATGPAFASTMSIYRTPLSQVLPSRPTGRVMRAGFLPSLTETGRRHPVTAGLPGDETARAPDWGRWFRQVDVEDASGQVVMRGLNERPLLILARLGEGRVAQLLSDHVWLWARGFEGGGPHAELVRRTAHWLMKEPELEEEDLRGRAVRDELRIRRRSLSPETPPVTVTSPSGEVSTVTLEAGRDGSFGAVVKATETGLYRLDDGKRQALAVVGPPNPLEQTDLRATAERLRPLLAATGGGAYWLADGLPALRRVEPGRAAAGERWFGLRRNGDYRVVGLERTPLLPALLVLLAFLGVLMAAWRQEGR